MYLGAVRRDVKPSKSVPAASLPSSAELTAADQTLVANERRYRAVFDAMPQMAGILDAGGIVQYANHRWRTYAGTAIDERSSPHSELLVDPEDVEATDAIRAAIRTSSEVRCEVRIRGADGSFRRHEVRIIPLEGSDNEARWMFTCADIPVQHATISGLEDLGTRIALSAENDRLAARALDAALKLLAAVEERARVGHFRYDLGSDRFDWSDEVYRIYGIPPSTTRTMESLFAAYHPEDRYRAETIFLQALEDGRAFAFSARIVQPDGAIRTVVTEGHARRVSGEKIASIAGIVQDVTTFEDAMRERKRLTERVTLATQAGKIGIWEWNVARNQMEWDGSVYDLYGIEDRTTVVSYSLWTRCIHRDDRAESIADLTRALDDAGPLDVEFRVVWPTGEVRYLRTRGKLVHDPAGNGSRMVGVTWDITELRVMANALREQKERAEEASEAKSEFLARMSHAIRTPMNGIIGFTTLVLDSDLSREQRRYITLQRDAGLSLLAIINDILDFSKLEAGKIELENIVFNLTDLVDGALAIVRGEALPKGIVIGGKFAAGTPVWVTGDPTRLRQILLNLLTNALKFTDHGSIRVRVLPERGSHADRIRFEIADTGIEIAREQQHLLFQDFVQLEKSTTRRFGGTGLGLAISKRLAEAMGGQIGVDSELAVGSVFWFTAHLPEMTVPALVAPEPAPKAIVPHRVLVADDNHINRIVVQAMLKRDGHEIVLVENGSDAVFAMQTQRFALILMDMQMPVMDGLEATRAIRLLAAPAGTVPIVALSANALPEHVELCLAAGMNDHLAKPIDRERLRAAIALWAAVEHIPANVTADGAGSDAARFADMPTLGIASLLDIFDGDLDSVRDVLDAGLVLIDTDLARVEESAATGDMEALVEAAHRMKGTSGSLGSRRIMEISATIQELGKRNPTAVDATLLANIREAVATFRADFAACRPFLCATDSSLLELSPPRLS